MRRRLLTKSAYAMLTTRAIQAFLKRPREDFRPYKKLAAAQVEALKDKLPVKPPVWKMLKQHQRVAFLLGATHKRFGFFMDCVAPETLINTEHGPCRIDSLSSRGQPIQVWANTSNGLKLVPATCPFKKGFGHIYEVTFKSGNTIRVTAKHHFLTTHGWRACEYLLRGDSLPAFSLDHPRSNLGLSQLRCLQDAQHLNYITPNYLDYCHTLACDEQPHLAEDIARASVPLQDDVPTRSAREHKDGQDSRSANKVHPLRDPLSNSHLPDLDCHGSMCKEYPPSGLHSEHAALSIESDSLILGDANHPAQASLAQLDQARLGEEPSLSLWEVVEQVKFIRDDFYYDLHVPYYGNYIAHGVCNHNTGTGKTVLSFALVRYLRKANIVKRVLVLVPNRINTAEWAREREKHRPFSPSIQVLSGSTERKWEILEGSDSAIVVTTYMGLVRMVSGMITIKKGRRKGKQKLALSPQLLRRLEEHIDGLILDESTSVQRKSSLPFRVCRHLSKSAKAVFLLTGTPFGRDPLPLWAQLYLIDHGQALGETLGLFRSAFYKTKENHWGVQEHTFDKKKQKLLNRFIAARTIRYEANAADLPKVVEIVKDFKLPQDTKLYYDRVKEAIIAAHGNYKDMKNAFLRLRQISSGFLGYKDDDRGVRAEIEFTPNPKLEYLLELIQSIGEEHKIVVFHEFIFSGSIIARELEKLDIKFCRVWGGTKDSEAELLRFVNDPSYRVFVVNNSAGWAGLNLQVAKYVAYYESPVSPIVRKQTERRVERQGSAHDKVFRYDLIVKGTVDQKILAFHQEGRDLFEAIVNGEASL